MAIDAGFAGPLPQLMLLLGDEPLNALLHDAEEPVLAEPGQIEGRDCYRVEIKRPDGMAIFWIDQETFVLRRIVFPTDELRQSHQPGQAGRTAFRWWPSSPARSSTARSIPRRSRLRCPRARRS